MNPQITPVTQTSQKGKRYPKIHAFIGAAMQMHRRLGCGFLEGV